VNPTIWLEKTVPGFSLLSEPERAAIKDFAILWTVYEGNVLNASATAIIGAANSLASAGKLSLAQLSPAIRYFLDRYFDGVELTNAFLALHMRRNDHRHLVENVLRGRSKNEADILSAILIIIYRLRNNLFHGEKWSYGVRNQLENFQNANAVLMWVIETHLSN
jgi:hypothetical protein